MNIIDYSGYKIAYFPEGFSRLIEKLLEDTRTQIKILKDDKELVTLDFIVPFKKRTIKIQEIINIAINKVKQIIDRGFKKNKPMEFEFVDSHFEEVIDLTK